MNELINAIRPSSIVRAVENGVIGTARGGFTLATLAVGSAAIGVDHAKHKARGFGRAISIELRARKLAAQLRETLAQRDALEGMDVDQRFALLNDQIEIARRAAQLMRKR